MKTMSTVLAAFALATSVSAAKTQTYTGFVSDSMCGRDHAAMNIAPQDKCVRECVGRGRNVKYVLLHEKHAMVLSDQAAPAEFAGQKVTITGVYYPKTNVLKVESIAASR
jgi:hypothetical protein